MKKHLLLPFALVLPFAVSAQTVLYSDDFEAYTAGDMIAQTNGTNWGTWSGLPGGTEDAPVSAAFAYSGANSIAVVATAATGGPVDLLLKLGDKTTGIYSLSFWMYIPSGMGGYFNVQHQEDAAPAQYSIDVIFYANGNVFVDTGDSATIGTYTHDAWFNVTLAVDLNSTSSALVVAGGYPHLWASNTSSNVTTLVNQLGSIDFFAYGGGTDLGEYYIDDVTYTDLSAIGYQELLHGEKVNSYPNPAQDMLTVVTENIVTAQTAVELIDVTGERVAAPMTCTDHMLRFNVRDLANGAYFVRITDGGRQLVQKVVKN